MIFLLAAVIILQLGAILWLCHRFDRALADREAAAADERRALLDRIQAPTTAAAQSLTERASGIDLSTPAYVSAFDDEQWVEYESKKRQLEEETAELIQRDYSPPPTAAQGGFGAVNA